MLELTQRNWLSYSINGEAWGRRSAPEDKFEVALEPNLDSPKALPAFHEAVDDAAHSIVEAAMYQHRTKGITVFYSGGIDSEISLRSLHKVCRKQKFPLKAVTLEFPNYMNADDVSTAVSLCKALKITHELIPHDHHVSLQQEAPPLLEYLLVHYKNHNQYPINQQSLG